MILLILLFIIYTSAIALLGLKLRDIRRFPTKYNKIPGFEAYARSSWFWKVGRDYGKNDPPDCCHQTQLVTNAVLGLSGIMSLPLYQTILSGAKGDVVFGNYGSVISILALLLPVVLSEMVGNLIVLYSKKPVDICCNIHHICRRKPRQAAWKQTVTLTLITLCVMMPFRLAAIFNYGYADDEKVVYRPLFFVSEQKFVYDELADVEKVYSTDGETLEHCYIYNYAGDCFDICNPSLMVFDNSVDINEYILQQIRERFSE